MNPKMIGDNLRELRMSLGKSMEEVSSDLGISQSAISMYEHGDRVPRDEIKIKLADYYNTSVQALFLSIKYTKCKQRGVRWI